MEVTGIRLWFDTGCDFDIGVLLYDKYGSNHVLKQTFRQGPNPFTLDRIRIEMEALRLLEHEAPVPEPVIEMAVYESETIVISSEERTEKSEMPNVVFTNSEKPSLNQFIEDCEAEWREAYKDASAMHQYLERFTSDQERQKAALKILELFEEKIHPLWDKINYAVERGEFPPEQPVVVLTAVELLRKIQNLNTYISKAKKKPGKEEQIKAWETERDSFQTLLDSK